MTGKIFILGVGAQKSGTTWLSSELKKLNVCFPFGKEAHVWNNVEKSNLGKNNIALLDKKAKKKQKRVLNSIKNPGNYFKICEKIFLDQGCPIADVTPIYCSLDRLTLCRIREGLKGIDFSIKVLFIARDPFSRVWSMHRMSVKRRLKQNPERVDLILPEVAHKALLKGHLSEANQVRTAYEKILPKLYDVFAAEEIGVFFYENLFSMNTYQSICEFLCLSPAAPPTFHDVRNSSTDIERPPAEIQREIVQGYRETYEYMRKAFPIVRSLWSESLLLLD